MTASHDFVCPVLSEVLIFGALVFICLVLSLLDCGLDSARGWLLIC